MDKKKLSLVFLIAWIVIMAAGTALMFTGITHESLWYDESYTAAIVNHSIPDIINITGGDSHPPLYYLMLHIFTLIFGNSVLALRAFSVLGVVALAAWGYRPGKAGAWEPLLGSYTHCSRLRFRSRFQWLRKQGCIPGPRSLSREARSTVTSRIKKAGLRDWIIFGVCTLAAAYTHYYALLAVVMICAMLLIMMLAGKKKISTVPLHGGSCGCPLYSVDH